LPAALHKGNMHSSKGAIKRKEEMTNRNEASVPVHAQLRSLLWKYIIKKKSLTEAKAMVGGIRHQLLN